MHSEYSGQTPRDRHSLKSEEQWRRVSRQNVSCLKLEHTFLTVGAVHQRPISEPFTSTGETASLSWDPVISSGRRETSHTAAPISPRQISADWVRATWCGPLRAFIYIWREKESELQILFKYSLYFPKMVETMLSISYTLNLMPFFGTPSVKQWGLYLLYLNLSILVTMVVVTLSLKLPR